MAKRFREQDTLLPPATLVKRLLAMLYDGLICIALAIVVTWLYTLVAAWFVGFDEYAASAEAGQRNSDPFLTSVLFIALYLFYMYFWTRLGQTLGMQVWRIRIENRDGTAISPMQALKRYMTGWISWLACGLGYFWMLWDENRETWTDKVSRSQVVSVPKK